MRSVIDVANEARVVHADALAVACPSCQRPEGEWCVAPPGAVWSIHGTRTAAGEIAKLQRREKRLIEALDEALIGWRGTLAQLAYAHDATILVEFHPKDWKRIAELAQLYQPQAQNANEAIAARCEAIVYGTARASLRDGDGWREETADEAHARSKDEINLRPARSS